MASGGTRYGRLQIALPSREEQLTIVRHLERALSHIDLAINIARRENALIVEYRTRLIADILTGKLDMREAAASLPDDLEKPDDLPLVEGPLDEVDYAELASNEHIEEDVVV
jgi:type I restriction enzyme S subunit